MPDRRMLEPARPAGHGPTRVARAAWWLVPVVAAAIAAVLVTVLPAAGAPQAPPSAPAQVVPGLDPLVQRWFKNREALQIELNNALQPAQKLPRPAAAARPVCTRLLKAASVLAAYSQVPDARLQAPVRAGLDSFVKAATVCLAGDLDGAEKLVAAGLQERTAVAQQIDELLDGD